MKQSVHIGFETHSVDATVHGTKVAVKFGDHTKRRARFIEIDMGASTLRNLAKNLLDLADSCDENRTHKDIAALAFLPCPLTI